MSRNALARTLAALLGVAGCLLCLVQPASRIDAQESRTVQVYADRSIGVLSGLLDAPGVEDFSQVFPFGVLRVVDDDIVRAQTHLHFPLNVFPPGTEVRQATLYVYVDGASSLSEASFGAYRILEPWVEMDLSTDVATWPTLGTSPVAVTTGQFNLAAPPSSPIQTPAPAETGSVTASTRPPGLALLRAVAAALRAPVRGDGRLRSLPAWDSPLTTPPSSPLDTPTVTTSPGTPTRTPTLTATSPPGATRTPTPTSTPQPTPVPTAVPGTVPRVALSGVKGTWLAWDVTVLMQAWMEGDAPNEGLALAPAPEPDAGPDQAGDLIVARQYTASDLNTLPHLIVQYDLYPVTPTSVPEMPPAGQVSGSKTLGVLLIGVALLALGLILRRT